MSQSDDLSFAIMNGECHITDDSICFTYNRAWERLERSFGKHSRQRTVVMAMFGGIPLICVALTCFALGLWHFAVYPLFFGLLMMIAPLLTSIDEEYSYPTSISRRAIQSITSSPPNGMRLSSFTITFLSEGILFKTAFCLPCGNSQERLQTFRDATEAFTQTGLMKET